MKENQHLQETVQQRSDQTNVLLGQIKEREEELKQLSERETQLVFKIKQHLTEKENLLSEVNFYKDEIAKNVEEIGTVQQNEMKQTSDLQEKLFESEKVISEKESCIDGMREKVRAKDATIKEKEVEVLVYIDEKERLLKELSCCKDEIERHVKEMKSIQGNDERYKSELNDQLIQHKKMFNDKENEVQEVMGKMMEVSGNFIVVFLICICQKLIKGTILRVEILRLFIL